MGIAILVMVYNTKDYLTNTKKLFEKQENITNTETIQNCCVPLVLNASSCGAAP
jgi:hypothetical protein